jgi:ketosteroid isomerase-like protein
VTTLAFTIPVNWFYDKLNRRHTLGVAPASRSAPDAIDRARRSGMAGERDDEVSVAFLEAFTDAWNRHDIDALMAAMTDDCVFEAAGGPDVCGTRYQGREAVRAGFAQAWATFPDAQWQSGRHFVCGDRGVSEWRFTGTRRDGTHIDANGCDIFTFRDGRIAVKNAFRKDRPAMPAGQR